MKDRLKRRKLKVLQKFVNFDFEDVRISGSYKYGFKFTFHDNNLPNELDQKKRKDYQLEIVKSASTEYILSRLLQFYRFTYSAGSITINDQDFKHWFLDKSKDIDIKRNIYFVSQSTLLFKDLSSTENRFQQHFIEFFSKFPM
jgi:hypothetical protein